MNINDVLKEKKDLSLIDRLAFTNKNRMLMGMFGEAAPAIDPDAINLTALIELLGRSAYDPDLAAQLAPYGWAPGDELLADCHEISDLFHPHGVALYFRNARKVPALKGRPYIRDGAVFAGFRVSRKSDMRTEGYDGQLPLGLAFHDTPDLVRARLGRDPDWQSIGDDVGAYRWNVDHYVLQVTFSLIDDQVYRVTCYAPFMT